MIESTKRDLAYYERRLKHLQALNVRIKQEGASAVPTIEPHPGRDRPLHALEIQEEVEEASQIASVVNALDSSSDADDDSM